MTTQKPTQNTGSNNNVPFNPHEYQASSAAVSFAALMEVLKAYQDMRNSTAEASTAITNAKRDAAINQANSTYNSYKADADMLGYQASEAWGQVAASAIQLGSGLASGYMCREASKNVDHMDSLANSVKTEINPNEFELRQVANQRTVAERAILDEHRNNILAGFKPDGYKDGLASKLNPNHTLTLRDVFETATPRQRRALNKAITEAQTGAHSDYQAAQNYAGTITGTFNAIGQGAANANSAIFKNTLEQQATLDKARAAQEQAYAAASKEFSDEVFKSMQSLIDQGVQGSNQVFQYMAQMVAQDTRA